MNSSTPLRLTRRPTDSRIGLPAASAASAFMAAPASVPGGGGGVTPGHTTRMRPRSNRRFASSSAVFRLFAKSSAAPRSNGRMAAW